MMAREIGICAARIGDDIWLLECSDCGPIAVCSGVEVSDAECIAHLQGHKAINITARQ